MSPKTLIVTLNILSESHYLTFWTDASAGEDAAIAAAVLLRAGAERFKLVVYLGQGSSSDAELLGGIFGLIFSSLFSTERRVWHSDCKSVIDQAARNEGAGCYWALWSYLSLQYPCEVVHQVSRDAGAEHLQCDRASRWIRINGERFLSSRGTGPLGRLATLEPTQAWHLLDGRPMRAACEADSTDEGFARAIRQLRMQLTSLFALDSRSLLATQVTTEGNY